MYLFFATTVTAAELAREDMAGALLMPSFEKGVKVEAFAKMLCDIHARSYIILRNDTSKKLVDSVQVAYDKRCGNERAKKSSEKVRLVVALDAEPSLMKYRMPGIAKKYTLKNTNELLADDDVVASAMTIAQALRDAGIRITFAPIYDTGANTSIIGNRAFSTTIPPGYPNAGTDGGQEEATRKANLFMQTLRDNGIIPAAKHFPGHGHAVGDTHKTLESIPATLPELANFTAAIQAGVPMVMIGHLVVKDTRTPEQRMLERREVFGSDGLPATLSARIMTDILRKKLGFTGIVITDSMAMGALRGTADRSVKSLEAGADIILIPPDPRSAYARIVQKMAQDKDFSAKVTEKAGRVLDYYR